MASHAAFLADILEHPDDDAPRLIYADWLDEHGGAADRDRAEFIRAQIELHRLERPANPLDVPGYPGPVAFRGVWAWCRRAAEFADPPEVARRRDHLRQRQARLWQAHREAWTAPVPKWARETAAFERGFLGAVHASSAAFVRNAAALVKRHPVRHIGLTDPPGPVHALTDRPALARFRSLGCDGGAGESLSSRGAAALAASPRLARLRALSLPGHGINISYLGGRARARAEFVDLRGLDLSRNALTAECVAALARTPWLRSVTALDLSGNVLGAAGMGVLAAAGPWDGLTHLLLGNNLLGEAGALSLARAPWSPRLAFLGLGGTGLWNAGVRGLVAMPTPGRLLALDVSDNRVGDAGAEALAAWRGLARATALALHDNEICAAGAKALADSPHLREVRLLNLSANQIGNDGVRAIAASATLENLTTLVLADNRVSDDALRALARSDNLPSLRQLQVNAARYKPATVDALKRRFASVY